MEKVVIKILRGSAATQTVGELYIPQLLISYSVYRLCSKNYKSWLVVDKVSAKIIRLIFLAHHVYDVVMSSIADVNLSSIITET